MPQADRVTAGNKKTTTKKTSGEKNVIIVAYNGKGKEHIVMENYITAKKPTYRNSKYCAIQLRFSVQMIKCEAYYIFLLVPGEYKGL